MEEFKPYARIPAGEGTLGSLGKERAKTPEPEEPRPKMFLIAGDNSGTGVLENLIEADGVGLIARPRRIPSAPPSARITAIGAIPCANATIMTD